MERKVIQREDKKSFIAFYQGEGLVAVASGSDISVFYRNDTDLPYSRWEIRHFSSSFGKSYCGDAQFDISNPTNPTLKFNFDTSKPSNYVREKDIAKFLAGGEKHSLFKKGAIRGQVEEIVYNEMAKPNLLSYSSVSEMRKNPEVVEAELALVQMNNYEWVYTIGEDHSLKPLFDDVELFQMQKDRDDLNQRIIMCLSDQNSFYGLRLNNIMDF